ncbi:MAG: GntR family transcriptional regulator [Azospirillaceae bacterium]|nr:GntR family transcriptional regulator [Azospirillaceae bacterium]
MVLDRKTASDAVAEVLRSDILGGRFAEGSQLRQEVLAAELGVSRIPLREAFRRLEAEGLITLVPHRGAVVSVLSIDDIAELFDLRGLIEPALIARAIPRLTRADFDAADQALAGFAAAFAARDINAWGVLNKDFHLALYRPAERPRSLALAASLLDQTERYTRMQLALTEGQVRAQAEHAALLRACRRGSVARAEALLRWHIGRTARSLIGFMRGQPARTVSPAGQDRALIP